MTGGFCSTAAAGRLASNTSALALTRLACSADFATGSDDGRKVAANRSTASFSRVDGAGAAVMAGFSAAAGDAATNRSMMGLPVFVRVCVPASLLVLALVSLLILMTL